MLIPRFENCRCLHSEKMSCASLFGYLVNDALLINTTTQSIRIADDIKSWSTCSIYTTGKVAAICRALKPAAVYILKMIGLVLVCLFTL